MFLYFFLFVVFCFILFFDCNKLLNWKFNVFNGLLHASIQQTTGTTQRGNLVVLGNKAGGSKGGLKALGVAAAPTPLNTPSLKRENNGKDVNTVLVRVGSSVWGSKGGVDEKQGNEHDVPSQQQPPVENIPVVTAPKTDPWALKEKSDGKSTSAAQQDLPKQRKSSRLRTWMDEDSDDDSLENEEEVNIISFYVI